LEDKGAALTVHFRQAPELAGEVLEFLAKLARESGLAVQQGKMVAELKEAHHDKGRGIAALLAIPPFAGRKPVFIGDDLTDESGFHFVNEQGGFRCAPGPRGTPRMRAISCEIRAKCAASFTGFWLVLNAKS